MSSYFRTLRRHWLWLLAAGLVLAAAAWWARDNPRRTLEEVLGTRDLPASVGSVECESWGFTDVLTTCAFTVDPADFPRLLHGGQFREQPCTGRSSWDVAGGPPVGPRFPVDVCYRANPPRFEHGGHARMAADADRSRVIADLYIE
jgi:hypothetical protein